MEWGDLRPARIRIEALSLFHEVATDDSGCVGVVAGDEYSLGIEDLTDLVAHQVVNRLDIQSGGQSVLDAVDDLQLSGKFAWHPPRSRVALASGGAAIDHPPRAWLQGAAPWCSWIWPWSSWSLGSARGSGRNHQMQGFTDRGACLRSAIHAFGPRSDGGFYYAAAHTPALRHGASVDGSNTARRPGEPVSAAASLQPAETQRPDRRCAARRPRSPRACPRGCGHHARRAQARGACSGPAP